MKQAWPAPGAGYGAGRRTAGLAWLGRLACGMFGAAPIAGPALFARARIITSATLRSDANREWYLLLYGRGRKYRIDLHPDGDGTVTALRLAGFTEELVAEHQEPPAETPRP